MITAPQTLIETLYSLINSLRVYDYSYEPSELPENGIYFFYEEGEKCEVCGDVMDRIVRIGTHTSDNRFRDRIRNHYRGNKNSSVFRTHVGSAIIKKNGLPNIDINEWMKHMSPTSQTVENLIDETFKGKFRFRCISIPSKDERIDLEERLIASLSRWNYPPSDQWLGHFAEEQEIRKHGLWNVQQINSQNTLNDQCLAVLKERANLTRMPNRHIVKIHAEYGNTNNDVVMCFIPCCKGKFASGNILRPEHSLSNQDLPNSFDMLLDGRSKMVHCIYHDTKKISALNLYNGKLYTPLFPHKNEVLKLIQSKKLRLVIISAGYGIIDALEPIHKYEAILQGSVATSWKRTGLPTIIADCILQNRPSHVYGFFSGEASWSNSGSQYRYFFTEGLKIALMKGFKTNLSGCFYKMEGGGFPSFKELTCLGKIFAELIENKFDEEYIANVHGNNRQFEDVKIGFDKISRQSVQRI